MTYIKSRKHPTPASHARGNGHLAAGMVTALAVACPVAAVAAAGPAGSNDAASLATGRYAGYGQHARQHQARVAEHDGDEHGSGRHAEHHGRQHSERGRTTHLPEMEVEASTLPAYRTQLNSRKFTQPLLDTTQTVQVIPDELFLQQGATSLTDVLRNSPGVGTFYVGENGNTATGDSVRMRGFKAAGSIFVDGVRDLGSISRDVFNIQQVQVTKGPDGTEYGRTAPTGAINMVTKQPFLGHAASGSVSWGSGQHKRATADWNQALGASAAMRLNVMLQDSGVPGREHVESNRWGVAPSFAFGLDTPTRVFVDLLHVKQSNVPDGGVFTIGLPGYGTPDPDRPQIGNAPPVDPDTFYGTDQDHDDVTVNMLTVRVDHDFNDRASVRNTTRWGRTQQDYLVTSFMGSSGNLLTPDLGDPSSWQLLRSMPNFKHQQHAIVTNHTNLRLDFEGGAIQHNLSMGLELTREKVHSVEIGTVDGAGWLPATVYDPVFDVPDLAYGPTGAHGGGHTDTYALYAFDTASMGEHW